MTRRMSILLAASPLAASLAASPLAAKTLAYEDNKLNFKDCAGADVTARWTGGDLTLSQAGKSPGDSVKVGWVDAYGESNSATVVLGQGPIA